MSNPSSATHHMANKAPNNKKVLSYRKYPSTTALQCFETAARHLSFTHAAQELHMTQSAVSKQVAQLEEMLNLTLFHRSSHKILLTPAGKRYYLDVQHILQQIESATTALMSHDENSETLKITSHPTFCARWLVPALAGFGDAHPTIHLDIKEQVGPFFSENSDADIAFLYGDGVWSGMEAIKLFDEYCIAVCHPDYFAKRQSQLNPQTQIQSPIQPQLQSKTNQPLDDCTLLHINTRPSAWYEYFREQGISVSDTFVGPRFDTFYACISAALLGYGIALVPMRLVEPELRSGQLVTAWDFAAKGRSAYYMTYPLALDSTDKIKQMINWITDYLTNSNQHELERHFTFTAS